METPTTQAHTSSTKEVKEVKPEIKTSAVPQANGKRMFEIYFRIGNRKPQNKIFELGGDLPEAISRARIHCERMGYRFCGCYPFLVDLDKQEESRNDELHENTL